MIAIGKIRGKGIRVNPGAPIPPEVVKQMGGEAELLKRKIAVKTESDYQKFLEGREVIDRPDVKSDPAVGKTKEEKNSK
jgi:hypothetical protein